MLMRPLPDVNEAYSMIAQQERQFHMAYNGFGSQLYQARESSTAASALLARTNTNHQQGFKKASGFNKKPVCTYCGFTSHTQDKCYKQHGYPPGWKPRPRNQSVNQIQCPPATQHQKSDGNMAFTQDDVKTFMEFIHAKKSVGESLNSPLDLKQPSHALVNTVAVEFHNEGMPPLVSSIKHGRTDWIIDSGATHHIVCDLELLNNQKRAQNMYVSMPNGQQAAIDFTGSVYLSDDLILHNALYIPEFHYNLIFVSSFIKHSNHTVKMYSDQCIIQDVPHGKMIGRAELRNGLYYLVFPIPAHPVCSSISVANKYIWGSYKVPTTHGHHYFLTILDDHSRAVWIYLMKSKAEVRGLIIEFCNLIGNQFGENIKCIRSDNGLEFKMVEFFKQKGIIHQTSCTYTPKQNSRVKRKHAYIINRLPSAAINNQVPYQVLIKRTPSYQHLRVFGCLPYATIVGPKTKMESRVKKCIFLGYAGGTKGYKVYDLAFKELFISRDVVFHELVFPFQHSITLEVGSEIILLTMIPASLEDHEVPHTQGQASRESEKAWPHQDLTPQQSPARESDHNQSHPAQPPSEMQSPASSCT
ncbi:PREDICTED: uncharacterized protein LOC109179609 [Ipomoea nil]|uniref:uncharacterized protein LOC109179609 n=1 Tax=Ipomoea nil TaxID=35883 RepID=UPI000901BF6C|nr:PREDICTED: uncharacterized protein LOC109179609 [Ipomoea nil]